MSRRLFRAVRLVALLGIAGTLSGCAVYPAGYASYTSPGYYNYGRPSYRPYYRPYGGWGYGYGRPSGSGGYRGSYGRPYW